MKVLITGSHGFVGTNLIESLSGIHEIIRWDVRSDEELPDCDAVIHLAGKAHDVRCKKEDGRVYYEVNTDLTKKIFDAFLQSGAEKFIFFSSIKAQDNDTPYAKSKRLAEEYIEELINKREDVRRNKKIYILRPCMIHGKGVKGNLPLLFKFIKKGWPWPLAAFENQRSYASMGNVSFVVNELLIQDTESGIYNLCDDDPVSTNDLIQLMSESYGHEAKMIKIPKGIIGIVSKVGDLLHLSLNTGSLRKLTGDYIVENYKIKRALGIKTMPIQAMEGLKVSIRGMMGK